MFTLDKVKGIIPVLCDVADFDATRKIVQSLGPIHLLVNNAGITRLGSFLEFPMKDFEE